MHDVRGTSVLRGPERSVDLEVHRLSQIRINKGGKRTTQRVSTKWVQKIPVHYERSFFVNERVGNRTQRHFSLFSMHYIRLLQQTIESRSETPMLTMIPAIINVILFAPFHPTFALKILELFLLAFLPFGEVC